MELGGIAIAESEKIQARVVSERLLALMGIPVDPEALKLYYANQKRAFFTDMLPRNHWTDTQRDIKWDSKPLANSKLPEATLVLAIDYNLSPISSMILPWQVGGKYFHPSIEDVLTNKVPWLHNSSAEIWTGTTLLKFLNIIRDSGGWAGVDLTRLTNH